jgi:hypothetical protein
MSTTKEVEMAPLKLADVWRSFENGKNEGHSEERERCAKLVAEMAEQARRDGWHEHVDILHLAAHRIRTQG